MYDISLQEKSLLEKLRAKQLQCIHSDRDIDDITSDLKTLYAQLNRDAQKQDLLVLNGLQRKVCFNS